MSKKKRNKNSIGYLILAIVVAIAVIADFPPGIQDLVTSEDFSLEGFSLDNIAQLFSWEDFYPDDFGQTEAVEMVFIDVGQGDSIVIGSGGKYILVDAGENDQGTVVLRALRSLGIKKLDALVLTHPHSDHIGGADDVIDRMTIDKLYMPDAVSTTKTYESVLDSAEAKGLKITVPDVGDTLKLGDMKLLFLHPEPGKKFKDKNDYSIIFKLDTKYGSAMFTGDAEEISEELVLETDFDLDVDVLKVGHHGSHSSTSSEFLEAVKPELAVISCGQNNDYGHPHKETMNKLKNIDKNITKDDGSILIVMDSEGMEVTTQKGNYD